MTDKSNTAPEDKDCWRTPPEIFEPINERFNFRYDMAAADHNALCARYYTEQDSALGISGPRRGSGAIHRILSRCRGSSTPRDTVRPCYSCIWPSLRSGWVLRAGRLT